PRNAAPVRSEPPPPWSCVLACAGVPRASFPGLRMWSGKPTLPTSCNGARQLSISTNDQSGNFSAGRLVVIGRDAQTGEVGIDEVDQGGRESAGRRPSQPVESQFVILWHANAVKVMVAELILAALTTTLRRLAEQGESPFQVSAHSVAFQIGEAKRAG